MAKKILVALPLNDKHCDYFKSQVEGHNVEFNYVDPEKITLDDVKDVNAIIGSIKRKWIKAAFKYCEIPYITVHGLRHTYASLLTAGGMDRYRRHCRRPWL